MPYFDDAKSLMQHSHAKLPQIKSEYENSLSSQNIDDNLLIDTKSFMENLRSALDYSAEALFDLYGSSSGKKPKIYFPYADLSKTLSEFRQNNMLKNIALTRPDIVTRIESYQHFSAPENTWLPRFMKRNNEYKHIRLIPQIKEEIKQLKMSNNGTGVTIIGSGKINIVGTGVLKIGGTEIRGPQVISTESLAIADGQLEQTIQVWTSFNFSDDGESVLPFLENALNKVSMIVNELSSL